MASNDRHVDPAQSASAGASDYEPPMVEVVVTAPELERETLYAGEAGYAIT